LTRPFIRSGDLRGGTGFSRAQAAEKQYLQSGLRPEIPRISAIRSPLPPDENPQIFIENIQ